MLQYLCDFHREQAWEQWTKDTKHGLSSTDLSGFLTNSELVHGPHPPILMKVSHQIHIWKLAGFLASIWLQLTPISIAQALGHQWATQYLDIRAAMTWLNFMSWYDDMSWHEVHFWSFNLPLHEKSHKCLINLLCWYLVSYEYMWPCTSRNIGQISYISCQLLVCSDNSQLSNYANAN